MSEENDGNFLTDAFGSIGNLYEGAGNFLTKQDNPLSRFTNLALSAAVAKYAQPQKEKLGYQGKVDMDKQRVRERVPMQQSQNAGRDIGILSLSQPTQEGQDPVATNKYLTGEERRPGGAGRRYFSDPIMAKRPETGIPTLEEAQTTAKAQADALAAKQAPTPPPEQPAMAMGGRVPKYANGGIAGAHKGYYLGGKTDGMADEVPARIDGNQEARLSDGEFVIPADVVSHLGNGNSDAGADQLHSMMDGVRKARTGNPEQGKQINPQNFMPKMAQGGIAQYAGGGSVYENKPFKDKFPDGDAVVGTTSTAPTAGDATTTTSSDNTTPVGQATGKESSLSNWVGDYVTEGILEPASALAADPYEAYEGPLTAGTSSLQDQAFTGISQLNNPLSGGSVTNQMGTFTPDAATLDPYMNPYTQNVIDRTAADMRRQSQIDALQDRSTMTRAGAFGGSRDALMRAERANNLNRGIGDMSATARAQGFDTAMTNARTGQELANQYGQDILGLQADAGNLQRQVAAEGVAADYEQFREERDFGYKQLQFLHSLLQGMPVAAQNYAYTEPSEIDTLLQAGVAVEDIYSILGLGSNSDSGSGSESQNDDGASQVVDENQAAANANTA
jgi:hypothetical protein